MARLDRSGKSGRFRRVSPIAVRRGEGRLTEPTAAAHLSRQQRGPMPHERQFPPPRLSSRSALSEKTFAGICGNEEDAPIPVIGLNSLSLAEVG
jgi:hypothetical protein